MSLPIRHSLEEVESILGSPPLLSTESADDYHAMLSHYMNALKPRDFVLQMFVKDLVDADWESLRLKRHKALAIERRHRLWRELQAKKVKVTEHRKGAAEDKDKSETERERLLNLEDETDELAQKCIELADGQMTQSQDFRLSRAMEEAIDYYQRLDRLEKDCLAKRVIIFEQFRMYDEALYRRIQQHYENQFRKEREMMAKEAQEEFMRYVQEKQNDRPEQPET